MPDSAEPGDTFSLTYPNELSQIGDSTKNFLRTKDGLVIGTFDIIANSKEVIFRLNENINNKNNIKGTFRFELELNRNALEEPSGHTYNLEYNTKNKTFTDTIQPIYTNSPFVSNGVAKYAIGYDEETQEYKWVSLINLDNEDFESSTIIDTLSGDHFFTGIDIYEADVFESLGYRITNESPVQSFNYDENDKLKEIDFRPEIKSGKTYVMIATTKQGTTESNTELKNITTWDRTYNDGWDSKTSEADGFLVPLTASGEASVDDIDYKLQKVDENGTPVEGATFRAINDSDQSDEVEAISDENGTVTFPNLKTQTSYLIKEIRAADGYVTPEDFYAVVYINGDGSYEIEAFNDNPEVTYEGNEGNLTLIAKNKLIPTTSHQVTKTWNGGDEENRPTIKATLKRYLDSEDKGEAVTVQEDNIVAEQTLNQENNFSYTWDNLPISNTYGEKYHYFVEETEVSGNNSSSYTKEDPVINDEENHTELINTFIPPTETPTPEKTVDNQTHVDLGTLEQEFTYDIDVPIVDNKGWTSFSISDTVDDFVTIQADSWVATVGDKELEGEITVDGRTITYTASEADIAQMSEGSTVTLSFKGRLNDGVTRADITDVYEDGNVPNKGTLTVNDTPKETNEVTVTPPKEETPPTPPIPPKGEKSIKNLDGSGETTLLQLDDINKEFRYDIRTKVPENATRIVISDSLDKRLDILNYRLDISGFVGTSSTDEVNTNEETKNIEVLKEQLENLELQRQELVDEYNKNLEDYQNSYETKQDLEDQLANLKIKISSINDTNKPEETEASEADVISNENNLDSSLEELIIQKEQVENELSDIELQEKPVLDTADVDSKIDEVKSEMDSLSSVEKDNKDSEKIGELEAVEKIKNALNTNDFSEIASIQQNGQEIVLVIDSPEIIKQLQGATVTLIIEAKVNSEVRAQENIPNKAVIDFNNNPKETNEVIVVPPTPDTPDTPDPNTPETPDTPDTPDNKRLPDTGKGQRIVVEALAVTSILIGSLVLSVRKEKSIR